MVGGSAIIKSNGDFTLTVPLPTGKPRVFHFDVKKDFTLEIPRILTYSDDFGKEQSLPGDFATNILKNYSNLVLVEEKKDTVAQSLSEIKPKKGKQK